MHLTVEKADVQWKFLIKKLIQKDLEKPTIDKIAMSLFGMDLMDFAVMSQNYPLCKVIHIPRNMKNKKLGPPICSKSRFQFVLKVLVHNF